MAEERVCMQCAILTCVHAVCNRCACSVHAVCMRRAWTQPPIAYLPASLFVVLLLSLRLGGREWR